MFFVVILLVFTGRPVRGPSRLGGIWGRLLVACHCLKLPFNNFFGVGDRGKFIFLFKVERLVLGEGVISEEDAFEMVVFMKDDASFEGFEDFGELTAVFVYSSDLDFVGSENGAIEVGDGETAFEIRFVGIFAKSEIV